MGKMTGDDQARLRLSLVGNFSLSDPNGHNIRITGKKPRVLLAMLATARDRRRSRDWLKSRLWSRSMEEQASNSLRQALHALRKMLEPYSDAVQADYEHVWLDGVDIVMDPGGDSRVEFFEDAPVLEDEGEDWLRDERQSFAARIEDARGAMVEAGPDLPLAPVDFQSTPCILIGNPVVIADDPRAEVVAERLTNAIETTFRHNGYVDTYDLRDMQNNQLAGRMTESVVCPPVLVEVRISLIGQELQATILARVPSSGRVVWTSSIGSDLDAAIAISSETMSEFVMGAVDSIEAVVMRRPGHAAKPTLYTAVHQLFALSREGIVDAAGILEGFRGERFSANAQAWRAFATNLLLGERLGSNPDAVLEAEALLEQARAAEPSNAVVLAISGHFKGFIQRDTAQGREFLIESRRILPNLAFGWDATAMNAIYSGDLQTAADAADIARRLGRYSPYKFYYDASAMIAATLSGQHERAVRLGETVLAKRPDFLPVMRHLVASYALSGDSARAMEVYRRLRELDPTYGTEEMGSRDYVLPAAASLRVIRDGLDRIGLPAH